MNLEQLFHPYLIAALRAFNPKSWDEAVRIRRAWHAQHRGKQ